MTRIEDRTPKGSIEKSGAFRLLGHMRMADLLRKSHSAIIGNGNELEDLIYEHSSHSNKLKIYDGVPKKNAFVVKYKWDGGDCDAVLLEPNKITLFEIKDGDNFDTKKAAGEYAKLKKAAKFFETVDPHNRRCDFRIILWNCEDLKKSSFKHKAAQPHLMRGRDFAPLVSIDYEKLNARRNEVDPEQNRQYMLKEMKAIVSENITDEWQLRDFVSKWCFLNNHSQELVNETIL